VRPDLIHGDYRDEKGAVQSFHTLPLNDPNLVPELEEHKVVNFQGEPDRSWMSGCCSTSAAFYCSSCCGGSS